VNLTDRLWDILRVLVTNHGSYGGVEFFFTRNLGAAGLTYPGGPSAEVKWDLTDLLQLRQFGLITWTKRSANLYAGKPTPFGINTARRLPAVSQSETCGKPAAGEPVTWPQVVEQWERIKAERGSTLRAGSGYQRLI
jgi:hypothetical protein